MRSAKFLLLHVLINSAIMGMVSIKIFFSQNLDTGSDDALVIPQILGVIPGLLFTVGQSMLMPDICPENNSGTTSNCGKVGSTSPLPVNISLTLSLPFLMLSFSLKTGAPKLTGGNL